MKENEKNESFQKEDSKLKRFGQKTLDIINRFVQTKVISSIMEAFIMIMPIVVASTIFILFAELPVLFGADPSLEGSAFTIYYDLMYRLYNLSYGIMGLAICIALTAKMTEKLSVSKSNNKISVIIVCITSIIAVLLLSAPYDSQFIDRAIFGASGIFIGLIVALTVPWFFWFCYRFNITIRLPKQVPQNISTAFLNIIPMFFIITIYGVIGWIFIYFFDDTIFNAIFNALAPLIQGANNPYFFTGWGVLLSLTWFVGIHPSVWAAVTDTLMLEGLNQNIADVAVGSQPTNLWANPFMMGSFSMGGTGAQIAVPLLIILFAKSKQLKSIGLVALIPIMFQVNEPILFGVPSVLNPIMLAPFLLTPLFNTLLGILFVNGFGMPASSVGLPWSMPIFFSVPVASQLHWLSFIIPFAWFGVSFGMYFPFILIQDNIYYKKEIKVADPKEFVDYRSGVRYLSDMMFNKQKHIEIKEKIYAQKQANIKADSDLTLPVTQIKNDQSTIEILVVCLGAGTSAMLAETINKAFNNENINAKATSTGFYTDFLPTTDLIIISPQARLINKSLTEYNKKNGKPLIIQTKGDEFLKMITEKEFTKQQILLKLQELKTDKEIQNEKI